MDAIDEYFLPDRRDLFWRFVHERQSIWRRRTVERQPPPWTSDPILQRERFTNVYRELDPGTRYVIERVLELDAQRADKLFNVMLYRLVGRSSTHAALGFQRLDSFDPEILERTLRNLRQDGIPPFTAAYMVSAYSSMGTSDKIKNVSLLFMALHAEFSVLYDNVVHSTTPAQVHATLSSTYGFGNFLAFQILVDLLYPLRIYGGRGFLPFSHDDWASAGPGALRGIQMLLRPGTQMSPLEVMRLLRNQQHAEFARLDLDFPYLEDADGNRTAISLANIQNSLCEFHKYVKIREGTGRGRRKFAAALEHDPLVQSLIPLDADVRGSTDDCH